MGREAARREAGGDKRLQKRIGGEAVRAVETRAGRLAHGRKTRHGGAPVHRRLHAATAVVGGGDDGDEVLRHVDAELQALVIDVGEALLQERAPLLADVEAAVGVARALHLAVDRARHDVARRERAARVVLLHERMPLPVHEHRPFAAHGLADEEALGLRVVEAGGVELDELHVRDLRARAPGEGHAVARRDVGIAGIEVDLAAAARREDRVRGTHGVDLVRRLVEHVRAHTAVGALQAEAARDDEVDHDRLLAHVEDGMLPQRADHRGLALLAGDVARVENAAHGVAALAAEVPGAVLLAVELHAAVDEVLDGGGGLRDDAPHDRLVTEAGARNKGVRNMVLERVGGIRHAADAALGEIRVAVRQPLLGDEDDPAGGGQVEGRHESAHSRADDEVVAVYDAHVRMFLCRCVCGH